jgi:hypothetical protein
MCPRPKCELVCEKPACEYKPPVPVALTAQGCCPCTAANVKASMISASETSKVLDEHMPSFAEVMSSVKFLANNGQECCKCQA